VLIGGEHPDQTLALSFDEEVGAGAEDSSDPVERIPAATAVPAGGLLDPLLAPVHCVTGQSEDMEGIHHRGGLRDFLGRGSFEAGEPVHRDRIDPVLEAPFLLLEPGEYSLLWGPSVVCSGATALIGR